MNDIKKDILRRLFDLERRGIKPGLERTLELLEAIGNPHQKFPSVHIAGTNGKGSTASIIASVLTEAGYKTGLYTSPHIYDFNERIRISGQCISDDELIELSQVLLDKSYAIGATFFEITSALAFWYFAKQNVDIAVLETGLGGRFDSTNVVLPLLSIITSIDIEHTEYLGNTIEQIAFEKGGIIKQKIPCVIGETKQNANDVFKKIAEEKNAELHFVNHSDVSLLSYKNNLMQMELQSYFQRYQLLETPLIGEHQLANHLIAVNALEKLRRRFPFTDEALSGGIKNIKKNTGLSRRIELIQDNPPIIFDVAHNPAALEKLSKTLQAAYPELKFNVVFAAMQDKDSLQMISSLKGICGKLILTQATTKRAKTALELHQEATIVGVEQAMIIETPQEAFQYALSLNVPILVTGSFFLIADINI